MAEKAKATSPDVDVKELLQEDEYVIGALMKLYSFQTADEQNWQGTYYRNDMGFNAYDSGFLSSLAQQYESKGFLTDKQIFACRKAIIKYRGQLEAAGFEPLPNNKQIKKKKKNPYVVPRAASMVQFQNDKSLGIKITFPYDSQDVARVKTLEGRRFHNDSPRDKYWTCPLNEENYDKLVEWGFEVSSQLKEWKEKISRTINDLEEIEVPGLRMELYPFQKKGVSFIEKNEGRALVADSMGLGKTAQALAWLQLHPEARPAVIVVPASLKLNWRREAEMWMESPNVQILSGTKADLPIHGEIIIINYDILSAWVGKLQAIKPKAVIADEAHYTKNKHAKRTKAFNALTRGVPHVIGLTGTPIVNRPVEMFNIINIIQPGLFPSFWKYAQKYCGAKHNGFGWDFNGASNTEELHEKLTKSIMIRRRKEEVLTELPPKQFSIVPMLLNNEKEYQWAEDDFIEWLNSVDPEKAKSAQNAEALAKIEALRQLVVKGKMDIAIDWIKNFLDADGKLVVFCTHKWTIEKLMDEFGEIAVKVDGSVTGKGRDAAVQAFQNSPDCRLFVGNVKAAGVGLTLTAASSVAFLELPWSPGDLNQAEDRIHRIGQESDSVNVYYLICEGTIEEKIAKLLDKKRKVLDSVLDGVVTESESLLSELIGKYQEGSE